MLVYVVAVEDAETRYLDRILTVCHDRDRAMDEAQLWLRTHVEPVETAFASKVIVIEFNTDNGNETGFSCEVTLNVKAEIHENHP